MLGNRLQMLIALGRRGFARNRRSARRNNDPSAGVTLRDVIIPPGPPSPITEPIGPRVVLILCRAVEDRNAGREIVDAKDM
jgi:hypothetical protein